MNTPSSTTTTRRWFTSLAALSGLVAFASLVQAQTPPAPGASAAGQRHSPERMAQAIDQRASAMVKAADGTPEQKDRLVKLAQTAMADMKPLREQHMAARKKGMELLAAPSIDRNALEQVRTQQIALADSMSKRMLQHRADAAEVFTPAQRTQLAERMKQRGERGHHGRHGGGGWGGGMGWGGGFGGG